MDERDDQAEGRLVARAKREVVWDERRSTVFRYGLHRGSDGAFVLHLDSYEMIRGKSFRLQFRSEDDVRDYLRGDGGEDVLVQLFGEEETGG